MAVLFYHIHDSQALLIVLESVPMEAVKRILPGMSEGGMPQVVPQRDGLGQILIQFQRPGNGSGYLRHLKGVCKPCAVMIALGRYEHLGLVLHPSERLTMYYSVSVPLEIRSYIAFFLCLEPSPCLGAFHGKGTQYFFFYLFLLFPKKQRVHLPAVLSAVKQKALHGPCQ